LNVGGQEEFLSPCSFAVDKINFLTQLPSHRPTFDYTTNRRTNDRSIANILMTYVINFFLRF